MNKRLTEPVLHTICITIDVDWASPEVLDDMIRLINERGIKATVFCSHPGIVAPGHERAIHPNFRKNGDSMKKLRLEKGALFDDMSESDVYKYIVGHSLSFCPEAVGVRAHSLIYDSQILPLYHAAGIEYESNYLLPLTEGLHPVWKEYDMLEIPIFFNDHFELKSGATGFDPERIGLNKPGLKVLQFHPNMVFINASSNDRYLKCKEHYHNHDALLEMRAGGRGARSLFMDVLDFIQTSEIPTATLSEVNASWRRTNPCRWGQR